MKNYPNTLKRNLLNTISQMQKELPQYTSDPQRNFTRNRKLPFEKLCRTILSMSGQNLHVELQRNLIKISRQKDPSLREKARDGFTNI